MSRTSSLGAFLYEQESSFGEDVAFGTLVRLDVLDQIDCSGLEQAKIDAARTVQLHGERTMPIRGVKGGSFTTRLWLTGHGSSTSGATAMTKLGTLLGIVIGNGAVVAASGTTLTGATDADTWATTASGTFTPGGVCFLGQASDGDGEGLAYHITSHTGTAMEVKNQAVGTPVATAVLYSAENIYPTAAASAGVTTIRARLMTANQQYEVRGCWPQSITFNTAVGEPPSVTITWGVAWWEEISETFPVTESPDTFSVAPFAGGDLFYQTFGTTTRNAVTFRSLTITLNLNILPQVGPGGVSEFQNIIGVVRGPYEMMLEWVEDAATASTSPTRPGEWDSDTVFKHLVLSFNRAASGKRTGLVVKKFYLDGRRPVQSSTDGVNRYAVSGHACADTAGTNDIGRAAFILALG